MQNISHDHNVILLNEHYCTYGVLLTLRLFFPPKPASLQHLEERHFLSDFPRPSSLSQSFRLGPDLPTRKRLAKLFSACEF